MKCCVVNSYKESFMTYESENHITAYYDFIFFNAPHGLKTDLYKVAVVNFTYTCIMSLAKPSMLQSNRQQ